MKINNLTLQQYANLAIVQFATPSFNTMEVITLGNALRNNLIDITEVNQSGNVNTLTVFNKSNHFVFLMDGDVLIGAKQNRVLNSSVLIDPNSKTKLPVSCVEAGRWSYRTNKFSESDFIASTSLRKSKSSQVYTSLLAGKNHYANQTQVWNYVADYSKKMFVKSSTLDLSEVYEKTVISYEKYLNSFSYERGTNGIACFIGKKLISLDVFNRADMLNDYFVKLLKGVVTDTILLKNENEYISKEESSYKLVQFIDVLESISIESFPGVALGKEKRFGNKLLSGFELIYQGNLIHLSAIAG